MGAVGAEGAPLSSRKTWMPKGPRAWRYGGFSRAGWTPRFPDGSGGSPPGWKRARTPTLLSPEPRGLSVKIRGGRALEAKAYRGSPGSLDVAGRARGRMESWRKWTTALDPSSREGRDPSCWRPVGKTRRVAQFSLAGGRIVSGAPQGGHEPRCHLELTEIRMQDQDWSSLGFEATGANPDPVNAGLTRNGWASVRAPG